MRTSFFVCGSCVCTFDFWLTSFDVAATRARLASEYGLDPVFVTFLRYQHYSPC